MKKDIVSILHESADLKLKFAKESAENVECAVNVIVQCLSAGGKILIFGNGGSAADAQHIAAEFVNRFLAVRGPLPAIALTTDTSVITSIANDNGFEHIFSRQIEAIGRKNDIAVGITTSGKSQNVLRGLEKSRELGIKTIALTGNYTAKLTNISDCIISVPSKSVPRIQEVHITVAHIICELVESSLPKLNKEETVS